MALSPFQDSIYARPGLTQQTRQFDRNPNRGESIFAAIATPSAAAVASEASSLARTQDTAIHYYNSSHVLTKTLTPTSTIGAMTAHRDAYRDTMDSASIKH